MDSKLNWIINKVKTDPRMIQFNIYYDELISTIKPRPIIDKNTYEIKFVISGTSPELIEKIQDLYLKLEGELFNQYKLEYTD